MYYIKEAKFYFFKVSPIFHFIYNDSDIHQFLEIENYTDLPDIGLHGVLQDDNSHSGQHCP